MEHIIVALIVVVLILLLIQIRERRDFYKREERYLNRIMAKDLKEYNMVTSSMEKSHDELVKEMELENELYKNLESDLITNKGYRVGS